LFVNYYKDDIKELLENSEKEIRELRKKLAQATVKKDEIEGFMKSNRIE
jgi:cell shape-determining protein MreC